jgi:hypothetical protein
MHGHFCINIKPDDKLANDWRDHCEQYTQMELKLLHFCVGKHLAGAVSPSSPTDSPTNASPPDAPSVASEKYPNSTQFGKLLSAEAKLIGVNLFQRVADLRNVVEHGMAGSNSLFDVNFLKKKLNIEELANLVLVEVKRVLKTLPRVSRERFDQQIESLELRIRSILQTLAAVIDDPPKAPRIPMASILHSLDDAPSNRTRISISRNQKLRMKGRDSDLDSLMCLLQQDGARVLIHGDSGCGKSMLADVAIINLTKPPPDADAVLRSLAQLDFYRVRASTESGYYY